MFWGLWGWAKHGDCLVSSFYSPECFRKPCLAVHSLDSSATTQERNYRIPSILLAILIFRHLLFFFFLFTILLTLMKYNWYSKMTWKKPLNDTPFPPKKSTTKPNEKLTTSIKQQKLFSNNYQCWMATTGCFSLSSR